MEELLAEELAARINSQDAYEKSIRESIAKEKAAKSSSQFRFILDDIDDEDTLDILQFLQLRFHLNLLLSHPKFTLTL
jgi:hypothetical protein